MRTAPALSVVMPVHNAETYLSIAVDSVLNQSFRDFDFHIVDDGSTDRTADILREYARRDARIVLNTLPQQKGIVNALNTGCQAARAEFIARMDADDECLPQRFARQVEFMRSSRDVGVVGSYVQIMDESGRVGPVWPRPTDPGLTAWSLVFACQLVHPSVVMRRDVLERTGYYTEGFIPGQDYKLWLRAIRETRLTNIPEVLLKYRITPTSVSHAKEELGRVNSTRAFLEEVALPGGHDVSAADVEMLRGVALHRYPDDAVSLERLAELVTTLSAQQSALRPLTETDRRAVARDTGVRLAILASVAARGGWAGLAWRLMRESMRVDVGAGWTVVRKASRVALARIGPRRLAARHANGV